MRAAAVRSGLAGTLALSLFELLERRLLGEEPVYSATRIAERLARRVNLPVDDRGAHALGHVLRLSYGSALAVVRGWRGPARRRSLARALPFGAAIYAFELVALPATGATPPLRRWRKAEVRLLAAHALAFACAAELGG